MSRGEYVRGPVRHRSRRDEPPPLRVERALGEELAWAEQIEGVALPRVVPAREKHLPAREDVEAVAPLSLLPELHSLAEGHSGRQVRKRAGLQVREHGGGE